VAQQAMSTKLLNTIEETNNHNLKKNRLTSSFLINDILNNNNNNNNDNNNENKNDTQINLTQEQTALFNNALINRQNPNLLFSPLKRSIHDIESLNESKDDNSEIIKDSDDSGKLCLFKF
jgi:hypothetical protein